MVFMLRFTYAIKSIFEFFIVGHIGGRQRIRHVLRYHDVNRPAGILVIAAALIILGAKTVKAPAPLNT